MHKTRINKIVSIVVSCLSLIISIVSLIVLKGTDDD